MVVHGHVQSCDHTAGKDGSVCGPTICCHFSLQAVVTVGPSGLPVHVPAAVRTAEPTSHRWSYRGSSNCWAAGYGEGTSGSPNCWAHGLAVYVRAAVRIAGPLITGARPGGSPN